MVVFLPVGTRSKEVRRPIDGRSKPRLLCLPSDHRSGRCRDQM